MRLTEADLVLQRCNSGDCGNVYQILLECGEWMFARWGLTHWAPPYPIEVMMQHAVEHEVFGVYINSPGQSSPMDGSTSGAGSLPDWSQPPWPACASQAGVPAADSEDLDGRTSALVLAATFTVGTTNWVPYFRDEMWTDPSHKALYLGKLAVKPQFHSIGLGRAVMDKVESIAKSKACQCIRFDAVEKMPVLTPFYKSCGYKIVGSYSAPDARGTNNALLMFEKVLQQPLEPAGAR